jgi:hypothetical protein
VLDELGKFCASCGFQQSKAKGNNASGAKLLGVDWSKQVPHACNNCFLIAHQLTILFLQGQNMTEASTPHTEPANKTSGWLRQQARFRGQWRNFYFAIEDGLLRKFDR